MAAQGVKAGHMIRMGQIAINASATYLMLRHCGITMPRNTTTNGIENLRQNPLLKIFVVSKSMRHLLMPRSMLRLYRIGANNFGTNFPCQGSFYMKHTGDIHPSLEKE